MRTGTHSARRVTWWLGLAIALTACASPTTSVEDSADSSDATRRHEALDGEADSQGAASTTDSTQPQTSTADALIENAPHADTLTRSEDDVSSVEGKWVLELYPNTMYLFADGLRYKYYCTEQECADFWDECEPGDDNALPGPSAYTYVDGVLEVDLGAGNVFSHEVKFICNGHVLTYKLNSSERIRWSRPGFDISGCKE